MKLSARNGRWNYDNRAMVGEENGVVGEEAEIVPPVCIGWKLVRVSLKLEIFDRKRTRASLEEELTAGAINRVIRVSRVDSFDRAEKRSKDFSWFENKNWLKFFPFMYTYIHIYVYIGCWHNSLDRLKESGLDNMAF